MSTHGGTHADAPFHYDPMGKPIDEVDLGNYIGPARLIDGRHWGLRVTPELLRPHLVDAPPRILLRTYEHFPHGAWVSAFTSVTAEAIQLLAKAGVRLIGVDAPSLDPQDSKTMAAHKAVRNAGMNILEGLVLDDVPAGDYELIALPMRCVGLDAAPVRAVLRELQ